MGYRQCSEFCLSCQRAAIFHDFRLSLFGERSAQPRHFLRIGLCLLFYSAIALLYIALFTSINMELALKNLLQKPVFYHLWFFFAIAVIYLVSPLIQVKNVGGKMLLVLMVVIGIIANPNTVPQKIDGFEWLPINLYINGDTFYYILYGMLGRAIGMMDTQHKALSWGAPHCLRRGFLLSLAGHYMNCSGAEILPIPGIFTVGRWFLSAQPRY